MLTLLIGAEALKTDAIIRRMLIENPDLRANFARDPSRRVVLRDPTKLSTTGLCSFTSWQPTLATGTTSRCVKDIDKSTAWLKRRKENFEEQRREYANAPPARLVHQRSRYRRGNRGRASYRRSTECCAVPPPTMAPEDRSAADCFKLRPVDHLGRGGSRRTLLNRGYIPDAMGSVPTRATRARWKRGESSTP